MLKFRRYAEGAIREAREYESDTHLPPSLSLYVSARVYVGLCPERTLPPHMRAFNKAVAAVFNSPGDDN